MANKIACLTFACLVWATVLASADDAPAVGATDQPSTIPNELNRNDGANRDNQVQPNSPQISSSTLAPINPDVEDSDENQYHVIPSPFNFFNQDQDRPRPGSLFQQLFGGNFIDSLRRQQELMDRQFRRLEVEANGDGQEISYFSRNGVTYSKTCTVKRVQ